MEETRQKASSFDDFQCLLICEKVFVEKREYSKKRLPKCIIAIVHYYFHLLVETTPLTDAQHDMLMRKMDDFCYMKAMLKKGAFLAGGFVSAVLNNTGFGDVDYFTPNMQTYIECAEFTNATFPQAKYYRHPSSISFDVPLLHQQIQISKGKTSVEDTIFHFDFDYTQCAIKIGVSGDLLLVRTLMARRAHESKIISYIRNKPYDVRNFYRRLHKTLRKKFSLPTNLKYVSQFQLNFPLTLAGYQSNARNHFELDYIHNEIIEISLRTGANGGTFFESFERAMDATVTFETDTMEYLELSFDICDDQMPTFNYYGHGPADEMPDSVKIEVRAMGLLENQVEREYAWNNQLLSMHQNSPRVRREAYQLTTDVLVTHGNALQQLRRRDISIAEKREQAIVLMKEILMRINIATGQEPLHLSKIFETSCSNDGIRIFSTLRECKAMMMRDLNNRRIIQPLPLPVTVDDVEDSPEQAKKNIKMTADDADDDK